MPKYPVYEMLRQAAVKWPEKAAVYDEQGKLSFAELFHQTEELKNSLVALGITEGMVVGLKAPNGRNFIRGLFAIAGCGAAVMPIYHQLRKTEIDAMIQDVHLHAMLEVGAARPFFQSSDLIHMTRVDPFTVYILNAHQGAIFAPMVEMPAFIRFTSGTTGKSKGVIISHRAAAERIEAANKGLGLGPEDVVVWVLPMAYHFIVSIVLYIRFGAAIAIAKDFLATNILDIANAYRGTMLYASPLQIRLLANHPGHQMMPSLRKIISTSAGISLEVCQRFSTRYGLDVSQAYGIIEVGLPLINSTKSADCPDAVGYPLPDYTVVILDDQHHPLPPGSVGQLGIKGPGMFDAYLLPARRREDVLVDGYFMTADYASQSKDGLVKIEGRTKSVINVSGIKIFPEEVEAFLETIPEIKTARISAKMDHMLGQILEGEVVLHEGAKINVEEVLSYCRKRLSNFKAPQHLTIVNELPMTSTGKLRRD
jgi:long-chain acyl-CoA synthetase